LKFDVLKEFGAIILAVGVFGLLVFTVARIAGGVERKEF